MDILDVHTPTTSFSIPHSLRDDSLETLFDRLSYKMSSSRIPARVGPGWLKYEWNGSFWTLDDESDYRIFTWRVNPTGSNDTPTLFAQNPDFPLPTAQEYRNPSFYAFKPRRDEGRRPESIRSADGARASSVRSGKSKRSGKEPPEVIEDYKADYKLKFNKFHTENGVRTVTGKIGPVNGVRMLLRKGHRHVYLSRTFALEHGFIPADTAPGHYGYTGLVQIGKWPITLGKTTTIHDVYLSEESHFDVILGRSFMERRGIKLDALDPTSVVCTDTGETIDCDLVVIKDWRGEVVTIT
ncbi:hypothetical protein M407DRAFT_80274 [Tulasnella calospora MUT 4182]|uniref:Uncharacterized protein n=1 Tax=Tulasnella calospora MUT 4182 TaxID=1051891 RepID=A0A0C3Q9X3_9AGAM|nr:hypothetical protein M407DRAFT_80274 [Tulasnella calospora MUT 4182]